MKDAPNSKRTFEQDNIAKRLKKELSNARIAGQNAVRAGTHLYTKEELMKYNKYSPEQADAYLEAYHEAAGKFSAEELKVNRAIDVAKRARNRGANPRSLESLIEDLGYNQAQIDAYYLAFDQTSVRNTHLIQKAQKSGRDAAQNDRPRKTEKQLMADNNYSQDQAQAYLKFYDKYSRTTARGIPRPTAVEVMSVLPAPLTNAADIEMEEALLMPTYRNSIRPK